MRRNPAISIGLGVVLIGLSFVVSGTTRDLVLRTVGVLAILVGAGMWVAARRG